VEYLSLQMAMMGTRVLWMVCVRHGCSVCVCVGGGGGAVKRQSNREAQDGSWGRAMTALGQRLDAKARGAAAGPTWMRSATPPLSPALMPSTSSMMRQSWEGGGGRRRGEREALRWRFRGTQPASAWLDRPRAQLPPQG
jgi:hypothetical protein